MNLNEFLNDLKEAVSQYEIPEYDEGSLVEALMAEKPELDLEDVFGEAFYPKVERWLNLRLKNIAVPAEARNYVGGPLKYKLDQYLKADEVSDEEYKENAESLAREILQAIEKWDKKVVKDEELPPPQPV